MNYSMSTNLITDEVDSFLERQIPKLAQGERNDLTWLVSIKRWINH